jgi:hypothetical protein
MRRSPLILILPLLLSASGAAPEVLGVRSTASNSGPDLDAWAACRKTNPASAQCRSLRSAAVAELAQDLKSLGGAGNIWPVPLLTRALASPEPELRAAAADGLGMIGPTAAETPALAAAFDDPVPAVRQSARLALGASRDPAAQALAGRAVHPERWKSLDPDQDAGIAKLKLPLYPGAKPLRFATDLGQGSAQLATGDAPDAVVAFYAGKAGRKALSLAEFKTAYSGSGKEEEEDSGDSEGGFDAAAMAKAMAMAQKMNEQMEKGKSIEEIGREMGGAGESADSAADAYSDARIYGSPRVVVLEESDWHGGKKPLRYVVVFRDQTLGRTGIALHGPPAGP